MEDLDAGPIAAQQAFPIGDGDDAGTVFEHAASIAVELLDDVLASAGPVYLPQATEGVTYAEKIGSDDRRLDLDDDPVALVRRVRALSPHIGARAEIHGRPVTVWRARVGESGAFEPLELQPDGGKRMDAAAWLRGLR